MIYEVSHGIKHFNFNNFILKFPNQYYTKYIIVSLPKSLFTHHLKYIYSVQIYLKLIEYDFREISILYIVILLLIDMYMLVVY